ncbi:MAG: DUF748 domain-containing protein [Pseudomonadota bacterium]
MPNSRTQQLAQSARNFSGKPVVRRTLIGLVVFVVLIGLFGFFALPGIIKSQAEKLITEKLHRQTTIGKVEVNPYAMRVTIHDMKLMEPEGDVVFASFEKLMINTSYKSILRFAPVVKQVQLSAPYVHLVRKNATHYNIDDIIELINSQPPSPEPARFSVFNIEVDKGRIELDDRPAQTKHEIADLKIGVPFISSLPSQVEVNVEPLLSATVNGSPLLIKGKAHPFADPVDAIVDLNLDDVDLTDYIKYVPGTPHFKVPSAKLDLHMTANFRQEKDKAPALLLSGNVKLKSLQVNDQSGKSIVKLPELAITLDNAKVLSERFEVAKLAINGIEADISRNANGQFNFDNLLTPPTPSKTVATAKTEPAPAATAPPVATAPKAPAAFTFALAELDINNAALRYADAQAARPVLASIDKFNLTVRKVEVDTGKKTVIVDEVTSNQAGFALQQGKPRSATSVSNKISETHTATKTPAKTNDAAYTVDINKVGIANWSARLEDRSLQKPAVTVIDPLALSLQNLSTKPNARGQIDLKASVNKNGQLAVNGSVGMTPLHTDLALDFKSVDIMQLQPYFTDQVNILLTRADISGKGKLQIDQGKGDALIGGFKGDLTLGNLATVDKLSTNDFLRWKSLYFGGMDVKLAPFSLSIDQVALSDFFARIIIDPTGRINLQDVKINEATGQKSVTEEHKSASPTPPVAANKNTVTLPPPVKKASDIPPIKIKKLTLQGGQIRFTDNFIKPNYTANLMKFGGVVSGLSSDTNSNANVDLKGQVNSAPLAVAGTINPLKGDLTMDIKAEVHGMELAPLSPYSGRYIGYGIEKGKLSFEVAYKIQDRVLSAQNRLILEQLTLGNKVESPDAPNLPVNFALALLRDRNGVIDINLPIGGSLDDPQFSIGGIIVKVIVNLITKAVTAPFALIGSLFGGGEELSNLDFAPGFATINDAGETKLKTMAKMLTDRPALKLEITGRTDPEADREGLKHASITRKVRALKLKEMVARGQSGDLDSLTVTPQEYPALLKRVYSDEKFPKPRNMIGLQKDLPVEEMEKLMVTNATVSDDDLIALGNRRAQVVKDWLLQTGKIPEDRIFILASKSGGAAAKDGAAAAKASRVDFSLK